MNIIPYNLFIYLNYLICGLWIVLPFVLGNNTSIDQSKISLAVAGIVLFFVLASSKKVAFPKSEILDTRIVVLVLFVHAIIMAFLPYLLGYTNNSGLFSLTYILAFVELVSILFTKIESKESVK